MTVEYVNHLGQPINFGALQAKQAKKPAREVEPRSLGFRVVGLPAGALDEARRLHQEEAARDPLRAKPWDEAAWLRHAKRERISHKNMSLRDAAEQMAGIARRSGWTHVEVQEVTRGNVEAARAKLAGF